MMTLMGLRSTWSLILFPSLFFLLEEGGIHKTWRGRILGRTSVRIELNFLSAASNKIQFALGVGHFHNLWMEFTSLSCRFSFDQSCMHFLSVWFRQLFPAFLFDITCLLAYVAVGLEPCEWSLACMVLLFDPSFFFFVSWAVDLSFSIKEHCIWHSH